MNTLRQEILARYSGMGPAHGAPHVTAVAKGMLALAAAPEFKDMDPELAEIIGLAHDLGATRDRETHHILGPLMFDGIPGMLDFLGEERMAIAKTATAHHRKSVPPPAEFQSDIYVIAIRIADTVYGLPKPKNLKPNVPEWTLPVLRALQHGVETHGRELSLESHWARAARHQISKYGPGGYAYSGGPEDSHISQRYARGVDELSFILAVGDYKGALKAMGIPNYQTLEALEY